MIRTYAVGRSNICARLDNHIAPWTPLTPIGDADTIWRDVKTDPTNTDKVIIVGSAFIDDINKAIQISTDAGVTWTVPGGDWIGCETYYEVWYVNSLIIWAVGSDGTVVISNDGGLTFNKTASAPGKLTPGDIQFTSAIHALNATTAVVLGSPTQSITQTECFVWKTIDSGATWTMLNSGVSLLWNAVIPPEYGTVDVGNSNAIWISPTEDRIIAATGYGQYTSIDNGTSFNAIPSVFYRCGIHMTWYPSYSPSPLSFRHVGGSVFQVGESLDLGLSFDIVRFHNGSDPLFSIPVGNLATEIRGAHFYAPTDGYYTVGKAIFSTSDGAVTGTLSYVEPLSNIWEAVWTSEIIPQPPFYQIVNCQDDSTICVSNDLSAEVLSGVSFQIEGYPNDCWTAEEILIPCINPISVTIVTSFFNCETCLESLVPLPLCYILQDCNGVLDPIITNVNLSEHLGTIVTIKDDTGHEAPGCWYVAENYLNCDQSVLVEIYKCYSTCEECLPPEPCPMEVKPRAVYPKYETGNCDPELVEKTMCNHADMMYNKMMEKRFAIQNCCPVNETDVTLKVLLMDLNLQKTENPSVDPCNPVCYRYAFILGVGDSAVVTYTDCDGVLQEIETGVFRTRVPYVFCAQNTTSPTALVTRSDQTVETHYLEPLEECS